MTGNDTARAMAHHISWHVGSRRGFDEMLSRYGDDYDKSYIAGFLKVTEEELERRGLTECAWESFPRSEPPSIVELLAGSVALLGAAAMGFAAFLLLLT